MLQVTRLVTSGANDRAVALRPEEVQDLDGAGICRSEPVRLPGVELGYLTGPQRELAIPKDEAEFAGQDIEPLATVPVRSGQRSVSPSRAAFWRVSPRRGSPRHRVPDS